MFCDHTGLKQTNIDSHPTSEESIKISRDWLGLGISAESADDIDEEDEKARRTRLYALFQRRLRVRRLGGGGWG